MSIEEEIPKALDKTGFPFENFVVSTLRDSNWSVISNRYYLDDIERRPRELDILAYKYASVDGISLRFALLISCKKDEKHAWAFLSRKKPQTDPNRNWEPTHYLANAEPLRSFWLDNGWGSDFIKAINQSQRYFFSPSRDIFANQLVSKDGKSPKNNSPIFSSVTGLMKALHHEKSRIIDSKRKNRAYIFLPITIVDAQLFDVDYDSEIVSAKEIEYTSSLMDYMIDGKDMSTVVTFSSKKNMDNLLLHLDDVYTKLKKEIKNQNKLAYKSIVSGKNVQKYFKSLMNKVIGGELRQAGKRHGIDEKLEFYDVWYDDANDRLEIEIGVAFSGIDEVLSDKKLNSTMRKFLKEHAHYEDDFEFIDAIPF